MPQAQARPLFPIGVREWVATDSAVLSVGLSFNAKPFVNCGLQNKGPRSKNALTAATLSAPDAGGDTRATAAFLGLTYTYPYGYNQKLHIANGTSYH